MMHWFAFVKLSATVATCNAESHFSTTIASRNAASRAGMSKDARISKYQTDYKEEQSKRCSMPTRKKRIPTKKTRKIRKRTMSGSWAKADTQDLAQFAHSALDEKDDTSTEEYLFLQRQLELFGSLCKGRNEANIKSITAKELTWEECFLCVQSDYSKSTNEIPAAGGNKVEPYPKACRLNAEFNSFVQNLKAANLGANTVKVGYPVDGSIAEKLYNTREKPEALPLGAEFQHLTALFCTFGKANSVMSTDNLGVLVRLWEAHSFITATASARELETFNNATEKSLDILLAAITNSQHISTNNADPKIQVQDQIVASNALPTAMIAALHAKLEATENKTEAPKASDAN